jgi:hypothetical protein
VDGGRIFELGWSEQRRFVAMNSGDFLPDYKLALHWGIYGRNFLRLGWLSLYFDLLPHHPIRFIGISFL